MVWRYPGAYPGNPLGIFLDLSWVTLIRPWWEDRTLMICLVAWLHRVWRTEDWSFSISRWALGGRSIRPVLGLGVKWIPGRSWASRWPHPRNLEPRLGKRTTLSSLEKSCGKIFGQHFSNLCPTNYEAWGILKRGEKEWGYQCPNKFGNCCILGNFFDIQKEY